MLATALMQSHTVPLRVVVWSALVPLIARMDMIALIMYA
jgi:hypothetical protein